MKHRYSLTAAVLVALLAPVSAGRFASPDSPDWQTGDLFAGVGRGHLLRGQYLVFDSRGEWKDTLVNPFAGPKTTTTGCAFAPPAAGQALYATGFASLAVTAFGVAAPHDASQAVAGIDNAAVDAIQSVAFDAAGNYYIGALPPPRKTTFDPVPPSAYILKYSTDDVLLATYQVPNGVRGANWIDVGSDQQTLYYTSEDTTIHVYRPGPWPAYREIVIKDGGAPIAGTVYGIRVLPPVADDPATPSGFLVASSRGILRLDADGNVRLRYDAPINAQTSFFAVNITPDGQSFWTATLQDTLDPKRAAPAGQLVKFHIPTGAVTAGPINTGAPNVWGLCLKQEYTAAMNSCSVTDASGQLLVDELTGLPVTAPCRVPEYCDNGADDDRDGLGDSVDPDCVAPRGW